MLTCCFYCSCVPQPFICCHDDGMDVENSHVFFRFFILVFRVFYFKSATTNATHTSINLMFFCKRLGLTRDGAPEVFVIISTRYFEEVSGRKRSWKNQEALLRKENFQALCEACKAMFWPTYLLLKQLRLSSVLSFCPAWTAATAYSLAVHSFSLTACRKFRLICRSRKLGHVQPILQSLHWLPTRAWTQCKISALCFNVITGTRPPYLSELIHLYTPSRDLRSSADTRFLKIPLSNSKACGQRSFSHVGPSTWNSLPYSFRHSDSQTQFRQALKTYLFQQSFWPSSLVSLTYFFSVRISYYRAQAHLCAWMCVCARARVHVLINFIGEYRWMIWCCKRLVLSYTLTVWAQHKSPLLLLLSLLLLLQDYRWNFG